MAGGVRQGGGERLLLLLLIGPALLYGAVMRLRAVAYRRGIFPSASLPRPVVSIGNITVGGTGKTPVTALVARYLLERGVKVAVLSRGYSGSREGETAVVSDGSTILLSAAECGDEPYLLAATVPGLVVVIGSDRHAAGELALKSCNPDLFLLDDGFQHLRQRRDLNILLLDARRPFGNGWCLPAGLLREPLSATERADMVIMTRCPEGEPPSSPLPGRPYCLARHEPGALIPLAGGAPLTLADLRGHRVAAFCGIAEPDHFFDSLRRNGVGLVAVQPFPDHERYEGARIAELEAFMAASGAEWILTTEKDGVKLGRLAPQYTAKILLVRLHLRLDDATPLHEMLCNLLQK
jgi:tetraacyldisaccharide 4'-kinase